MYVPLQRITQSGAGGMLYWFHHIVYLPEQIRWLAFVRRHSASCYVMDLPTAAAARDLQGCHRWFVLRLDIGMHQFLAGYTSCTTSPSPAQVRGWWCAWRFYLQSCGHMVHSRYTDMRLLMLQGWT